MEASFHFSGEGQMSKSLVLAYGIISYFIGVAGLVSIIAVLAGFMPFGFLWGDQTIGFNAVLWNASLVTVWGVVHSIMARPSFKTALIKLIPEPAERPTYILVAGLTSIILTGYWMIVPGQVWQIDLTWAGYLIWAVFWFGWAFLLASTFAINHFDLFGLRQVYLNFKNQPRPPLTFVKRAMYKYVRHPIQTGVLIGVWVTPLMTKTQIILSLGFTVYIFVGLWFEERDLIKEHGESYLAYKKETGSVFPKLFG
jgi:protein-S-isoprenylcysteine O-methyltransferase Ste14